MLCNAEVSSDVEKDPEVTTVSGNLVSESIKHIRFLDLDIEFSDS
jgi:hypothetical protein